MEKVDTVRGLVERAAQVLEAKAAELEERARAIMASAEDHRAEARAQREKAAFFDAALVGAAGPLGRVPVQTPAMLAPASQTVDSGAAVAVPSEVTK